jgi:hypothetical protein
MDFKKGQNRYMWQITAQIETRLDDEWERTRQIPSFMLDGRIQGIVSAEHAASIARQVIDPLGVTPDSRIHVTAVEIPEDHQLVEVTQVALASFRAWTVDHEDTERVMCLLAAAVLAEVRQ